MKDTPEEENDTQGAGSNSEDEEQEEEYFPEKILNKRFTIDGCVEYYVKWKGLNEEENTWEFGVNLDCELIKEFEEKLQKTENAVMKKEKSKEQSQFQKKDTFVCCRKRI